MRHDLAQRRGFLWLPVAAGLAAGVRLSTLVDPAFGMALATAILAGFAAFLARNRIGAAFPVAALAAAGAFGWLAVEAAMLRADAPRFTYERTVMVSGYLETVEERGARGHRVVLRPTAVEPPPSEGVPYRVRLTVRKLPENVGVGAAVAVRARLGPPGPPLIPGGYDFARVAWFERIGATGFALGSLEAWPDAPPGPADLRAWSVVEDLRRAVSQRVRAVLPGDSGAIAAALLVGDRGSIAPETDEAMRIAGISHILSISGLHMTIVTGCIFFAVRLGLAAVPAIALRHPVKQWAAFVSLLGCAAYLLVSGMGVPAVRAALMVAVGLVAVMLDRKALSLRTVAISALLIIAVEPQSMLEPGTQMSFAAVTALIAAYEGYAARRRPPADGGDISPVVRFAGRAIMWVGAAAATSLIAGLATFPAAVYHFNRVSPLGLVANLATTPLVSFIIMPMAVATAMALPLGLEMVPLHLMGWAIDAMIAVAVTVAAWTPQGGVLGRPPAVAMVLMSAGGLWLCLWFGRHRWAGLPPILLGMALVPFATPPDLLVDGEGRRALIRLADGTVQVLGDADDFQTSLWLAALGRPEPPRAPSLVTAVRCDPAACILLPPAVGSIQPEGGTAGSHPGRVMAALIRRPDAFADECGRADLVLTALHAPPWCRDLTTVVDATDLRRAGTRSYRIRWSEQSGMKAGLQTNEPLAETLTSPLIPPIRLLVEPLGRSLADPPPPWHRTRIHDREHPDAGTPPPAMP